MKLKLFFVFSTLAVLSMVSIMVVQASKRDSIADVRDATAQFHHTLAARTAGYNLVPGLDYCFQNYGVGGMGYHYINTNLIDTIVDLLHPEAMVYAPDVNGSIQLGAVEYIVPVDTWDAEYDELPQVLGQNFHFNERLDMYVLHAWIWKNNSSGMFEDWNPEVVCPAPLNFDLPFGGRWR